MFDCSVCSGVLVIVMVHGRYLNNSVQGYFCTPPNRLLHLVLLLYGWLVVLLLSDYVWCQPLSLYLAVLGALLLTSIGCLMTLIAFRPRQSHLGTIWVQGCVLDGQSDVGCSPQDLKRVTSPEPSCRLVGACLL